MPEPTYSTPSALYCRQGHINPSDSRFCRLCGESLSEAVAPETPVAPAADATIVGLRYRIRRTLGHGGFGRTYLAEDVHRFDELCVLKEFAPQVEGQNALEKAESLFAREAGVLYRLRHPQIPQFREILRAEFEGRERLFLVQDYVDGLTYQDILERRQQQQRSFTETEVIAFLTQILPVLDYIHRMGVIHRDISPDNLIRRNTDQLPILIDFGGVKQAAATVISQFGRSPDTLSPHNAHTQPPDTRSVTLVGKIGFAPYEQMQQGQAEPCSDLYALAVTALVMLTGSPPTELLDVNGSKYWTAQVRHPLLVPLFTKMLSPYPGDRYPSAQAVLDVLQGAHRPPAYQPPAHPAHPLSHQATVAVAPAARPAPRPAPPPTPPVPVRGARPTPTLTVPARAPQFVPQTPGRSPASRNGVGQMLLVWVMILGVAGLAGWAGYHWLPALILPGETDQGDTSNQQAGGDLDTSSQFSDEERSRKAALRERRDALEVDNAFLVRLTDAQFYAQYPGQQGRTLSDGPGDAEWRSRWDDIAADWLDLLDTHLSARARRQLGRYTDADREQWEQALIQLHVGDRALKDLTNARFFQLFPDLRGENFRDQPLGQIWYGMAADQVRSLQSGETLTTVNLENNGREQVTGTLQPGAGQVYVLNAEEGDDLRLDLQAPERSTRLALYVPRPTDELPFLLEPSRKARWSGELPQAGYYEVVVVSTADEAIDYELELKLN
ncbi:MAG: serine/threonine-protein kinase [Synechococcales bacterium]|nr:serine/threonine-protein kinase [Synechococcales bacterium]